MEYMGNMFHSTQYDQESVQHEAQAKTPSATGAIVALVAAAATQSLVTPVATSVVAPPLGLQKPDKDATNVNLDYEEGLGRGFRALREGVHKGRDFAGVMDAIVQLEKKGACILLRKKLTEDTWVHSRNDVV